MTSGDGRTCSILLAHHARWATALACAALAWGCADPGLTDFGADAGGLHDAGADPADAGPLIGTDDAGRADAGNTEEPSDAGATDAGSSVVTDAGVVDDLPDPVLFVHGINGSAADFDAVIARLVADGWPADRLFAYTFDDPSWGCNVDNAATLAGWIEDIRAQTGASRVDLVAHSMGSLSTRYDMRFGTGTAVVNTYITLGGQHHGLWPPCGALLAPFDPPCVWVELCASGPFIEALNTDPVTPGPSHWVSIYSTEDETVPASQSVLDGAENIELHGPSHMGLLNDEEPLLQIERALLLPAVSGS